MLRDHRGVKGAKPRLKPAKEELPRLSRDYLLIRNRQMLTKNLTVEMQLAERRGELIEKRLVEQQAAYLFIAFRQKILALPHTHARKMVGLGDAQQAAKALKELAVSLLNEIRELPAKVTDPNWLDTLEADGSPCETVETESVLVRKQGHESLDRS
jgi:hypothetical protein